MVGVDVYESVHGQDAFFFVLFYLLGSHGWLCHFFLVSFAKKIGGLSFVLGSVLVGSFIVLVEGILLEESLFGHIFLEIIHVQRAQNLFDIDFGQILNIVA